MTVYTFTGPHTRRSHRGTCPTCGKKVTRSRTFEKTVNPFNRHPDGTVKTWDDVAVDVRKEADAWVPNFHCNACDVAAELARSSADDLRQWIRAEAHYRDNDCVGKPTRVALSNARLVDYEARLAAVDPTLGDVTVWSEGGVYRCYYQFADGSRCVYGTRHGAGQHLSPVGEWATVGAAR